MKSTPPVLTIKAYLTSYCPSDYQLSMYAQKRKDLGLNPLTDSEMVKRLKFSWRTLNKYREIATRLSKDYRLEKKRTCHLPTLERPTDFSRYCWETIHFTKILLEDVRIPEQVLFLLLETQLQDTNLLTLEAFKDYESRSITRNVQLLP